MFDARKYSKRTNKRRTAKALPAVESGTVMLHKQYWKVARCQSNTPDKYDSERSFGVTFDSCRSYSFGVNLPGAIKVVFTIFMLSYGKNHDSEELEYRSLPWAPFKRVYDDFNYCHPSVVLF